MTKRAFITHDKSDKYAWRCVCGNTPVGCGFYSCDENGNEVEPTEKDWTTDWYVCADCGRMIDQDTLKVVGRNLHPKFLA
jgi:hypothetical protein